MVGHIRDILNEYLDKVSYIDYSELDKIFGFNQDEIIKILHGRLEIYDNNKYICIDNVSGIEFTKTLTSTIYDPITILPSKGLIFRWRKKNVIGYYDEVRQYFELIDIRS